MTAAAPIRPRAARVPRARRGAAAHPSTSAARLADVVLGWEGVTARRGVARLGSEPLGRLPRQVRTGELDRVVAAFRERYEGASRAVDRRAGVRD